MSNCLNRINWRRYRWFPPLFLFVATTLTSSAAWGQVDLSGEWAEKLHEDWNARGDVFLGDYVSLPINNATRMRADTWDAEQWTMREYVCHEQPGDYLPRAPSDTRIWADVDPLTQGVTAWHAVIKELLAERTIYMDGRPHPAEFAPHTWQGFSTGEWEGDMLKVTTTHLKEGYLRRNGLARSEKATMTEYFIRYQNNLTLLTIVDDPVYLTEPLLLTSDWVMDLGRQLPPNFCTNGEEIKHPKGWVAYHLPGQNQWLHEFSERSGIPYEATRGGAETMYPEYQEKLATMPIPPKLASSSSEKGK